MVVIAAEKHLVLALHIAVCLAVLDSTVCHEQPAHIVGVRIEVPEHKIVCIGIASDFRVFQKAEQYCFTFIGIATPELDVGDVYGIFRHGFVVSQFTVYLICLAHIFKAFVVFPDVI